MIEYSISLHEVLVTLFLFLTAPVSAHMLAKAGLHLGLSSLAKLPESSVHADSALREASDHKQSGE